MASGRVFWDQRFPLMGIKDDVLINKRGELTVGWELELAPAYTFREEDFTVLNEAMISAVRNLPAWCVIHRQDMYRYDRYVPRQEKTFLASSYEKHFGGRRYLVHKSRLFLTFSSRAAVHAKGSDSGLLAGFGSKTFHFDREAVEEKFNRAGEFMDTLVGTGLVSARRLERADYIGTDEAFGIIEESYLLGMQEGLRSDLKLTGENVLYGDTVIFSYHLGEARKITATEFSDSVRVDSLSGTENSVLLSFGAKSGILLANEHIVNHYVVTVPQGAMERELESERKRKVSGAQAAENQVGVEEAGDFMKSMYAGSSMLVLSSLNVVCWCHKDEYSRERSKVGSALQGMGIQVSHNLIDTPQIWYAGIPGAGSELPYDCLMRMEAASAFCMYAWETYTGGDAKGNFRVCDKIRMVPISLAMNCEAFGKYVTDYNMMVIGSVGSGKSFFMNSYLRNCHDNGYEVFLIDKGGSYEGLTQVINEESGGKEGFYYSWDDNHTISFNPFGELGEWVDGNGTLDVQNLDVIYVTCFLQTLWSPRGGWTSEDSPILSAFLRDFAVKYGGKEGVIFQDFIDFMVDDVMPRILRRDFSPDEDPDKTKGYYVNRIQKTERDIDIKKFCTALEPYGEHGSYGQLLNDRSPRDMFSSVWTVCEISRLADDNSDSGRMFYALCVLSMMNAFMRKMRQNTTKFKFLVLEEAWMVVANPTMAPFIKMCWKEGRKYNVSNVVVTQDIGDLVATEGVVDSVSSVIKDAIIANTSTRVLLDQKAALSSFPKLSSMLKLTPSEQALVLSVGKSLDPRFFYREAFISRGRYGSVYAVEVSEEEALVFESNKETKAPLLRLALDRGSMCVAAAEVAERIRAQRREAQK